MGEGGCEVSVLSFGKFSSIFGIGLGSVFVTVSSVSVSFVIGVISD